MSKKEPEKEPKEDRAIDLTLRPASWDEYVGQEKIKGNLAVILEAAKKRKEVSDHLLFSGPALEKAGDLAAVLTNLNPGEILFIDEAHRINPMIEEVLYPAMESRKLHLVVGKGPSARTLSLDLPPFTLIAATTRENLLSQPLRSRFGATLRLGYYETDDIKKILSRSAGLLNIEVASDAVDILARASRGTPRVANRLLKRARDFAEVHGTSVIDRDAALKTLDMLEIDA